MPAILASVKGGPSLSLPTLGPERSHFSLDKTGRGMRSGSHEVL